MLYLMDKNYQNVMLEATLYVIFNKDSFRVLRGIIYCDLFFVNHIEALSIVSIPYIWWYQRRSTAFAPKLKRR